MTKQWTTDAGDLGWAPGQVPQEFTWTPPGGYPSRRFVYMERTYTGQGSDLEVSGWRYRDAQGNTLWVFND